MPTPFRIVDLDNFTSQVGIPAGTEIAEVSSGGLHSYQIPLAVLAYSRQPSTVNAGGTFNVAALNFGDILVTTTAAVTVQLPASGSRFGVPVSVIAQQITTPNITIMPNGAEKLIGQSSLTITNPYGAYTLWPLAAGGYYQK